MRSGGIDGGIDEGWEGAARGRFAQLLLQPTLERFSKHRLFLRIRVAHGCQDAGTLGQNEHAGPTLAQDPYAEPTPEEIACIGEGPQALWIGLLSLHTTDAGQVHVGYG